MRRSFISACIVLVLAVLALATSPAGATTRNQVLAVGDVTYPNGGETLTGASTVTITWVPPSGTTVPIWVSLYYSIDSGANWTGISPALHFNDGADSWTVPNIATTHGRIKVEVIGGPTDVSDADFTIVDGVPPAQTTPDAVVHCESITLQWYAPGDDGNSGTATMYDLRRNTTPFTEANFGAGTSLTAPTPAVAGTLQSVEDYVGSCSSGYYYALKTRDEVGNWSPMGAIADAVATPRPSPHHMCEDAFTEPMTRMPNTLQLATPSPNPVRLGAAIPYGVPASLAGSHMDLGLFDLAGRRMATLFHGPAVAGFHTISWERSAFGGSSPHAGVYFLKMVAKDQVVTRMVVVRE